MNSWIILMIESPMLWIFVLAVIVLLFGGSKLPQLAKALGQSKRAFREGISEAEEEARLEKGRGTEVSGQKSQLADVDDEQLFEEARRRATRVRAAETNRLEGERVVSDRSTDNPR